MLVVIDNYDSFTYNLVQAVAQMGATVKVFRNDAITIDQIAALHPAALIVSPGPGRPETAGVSLGAIQRFSGRIPILGVCLGHQAIGIAFGAEVIGAKRLMHGKTSMVTGDGQGLFQGITKPFQAMRYHSLAVAEDSLPDCLAVTARAEDGQIMGLRHRAHPTEGVQFHPESIGTPLGKRLLRNFCRMAKIESP